MGGRLAVSKTVQENEFIKVMISDDPPEDEFTIGGLVERLKRTDRKFIELYKAVLPDCLDQQLFCLYFYLKQVS